MSQQPETIALELPDDVAAILDHLNAERCLVGGNSGGGPHAQATAQ